MPDSKFYRATTARARCEAGQFVLMGRTLRAFSLTHFALLEELLDDDLYDPAPDLATLDILSRICSTRRPADELADLDALSPEARERHGHSLLQFVPEDEQKRWADYMAACFLSRPRTRQMSGGKTLELRAPYTLIVTTWILRHLHGITHEELWLDWPVGQVLWQYEAAKEQINEVTTLAESDEPAPEPTPEEKAAEEKHAALEDPRDPAHAAIEAEQLRLLLLAQQGRLNDDLTETEVRDVHA